MLLVKSYFKRIFMAVVDADIMDDDAVPKHFKVPDIKPKPETNPKAAPKPGPKGQHKQEFRMLYHRKEGFMSEPFEH